MVAEALQEGGTSAHSSKLFLAPLWGQRCLSGDWAVQGSQVRLHSRKEGKDWSPLGAVCSDFTLVTYLILRPLKTMNNPVFREEETEAIPR